MKTVPLPSLRVRGLPAAALALTMVLATPAHAARATSGADAEIRALLAAQMAAWNRGDLEGFMGAYWRSDSLTFYSGGDVSHGWQAALDRYRRRYQGEGREMGTLAFDLHAVDLVARDVAIVKGGWSLRLASGAPHGLFTLVLRRIPGSGWRVVHDHSSAAAP